MAGDREPLLKRVIAEVVQSQYPEVAGMMGYLGYWNSALFEDLRNGELYQLFGVKWCGVDGEDEGAMTFWAYTRVTAARCVSVQSLHRRGFGREVNSFEVFCDAT